MYQRNTLFSRLSILLILILCATGFYSQDTGPGGVGTSANNVFWLDANQLGLTNGSQVVTWTDASGNGNDFTQASSSFRPVFLSSGSVNSMPSVSFDGANDLLESGVISRLNTDVVTFFTVYKSASNLSAGVYKGVVSTETSLSNATWGVSVKRDNNFESQSSFRVRNSSAGSVYARSVFATSTIKDPKIASGAWTTSNQLIGYTNGGGLGTGSGGDASGFTHIKTRVGALAWGNNFIGEICEVIVFDEQLNAAKYKIILNYLAAKYNITLSGFSVYAFNSTHGKDLGGIGRETSSATHLSARGTGIISMTSAGISTDGAYLLWGHNNGGTSTTGTNVPSGYAVTNGVRLQQIWRVSESSDVGNVDVLVDLSGITFGDASEYELLIDSDGDFSNATRIAGVDQGGDVIKFTVTGAQLQNGNFFTIGSTQETIFSIVDGQDWNDPTTWSCGCIPSSDNNVVIRLGHEVTLTDNRTIKGVDVEVGGSLVMDNATTFELKADLNVSGSFSLTGTNKIVLSGTSFQTLNFSGAIALDSLTLDNNNGAILNSGSFTFSGAVTPTSGTLNFNNNSVTFLSNSSGTASVGPQGAGATLTGLGGVSVQRFIPSGIAGMRNVGFPFASSFKLSEWDDEIFISGPGFPDGCASSSSGCYTSAKYWVPGGGNGSYASVTDLDSVINAGRGIEIYLGDNLNTFSAHTITANSSSVLNLAESVNLTLGDGWNFIANPFLSPVDFDDFTLPGSTGNYFYVYNPNTGGFEWYDGASQSTSNASFANGILSAFQGFWVFDSSGGSVLSLNQSAKKVASNDAFFKNQLLNNNRFTVVLTDKEMTRKSEVLVNFSEEKNGLEIPKLPAVNGSIDMYTISTNSGKPVSSVSVSGEDCIVLPLKMDRLNDKGAYAMSFRNVPSDWYILLENNETGEKKVVSEDLLEVLQSGENSMNDNYQLVMKKSLSNCEQAEQTNNFEAYTNGGQLSLFFDEVMNSGSLRIHTLSGKLIDTFVWTGDYASVKNFQVNLSQGIYLVSVTDNTTGEVMTKKVVCTK